MSKFIRMLPVLPALLLAACAQETETAASPEAAGWRIAPEGDLNAFFDCLDEEGASLVAAHRGGPAKGYPENALETFKHTLFEAPALMEIDVATSSDGVLYLMHDDMLDRTTTGSGPANALPWAEVEKLRLEDDDGRQTKFAPTRFDEALEWAKGRTILEVDFKRTTKFEAVIDEIRRQHAEDSVILIAYTLAQAEKLHRLMPEAMISLSLTSQSELNRAVAEGIPADRLLGFTGVEAPNPRLFGALAERDVEVVFGTLGGADSIDAEIARSGDEGAYADLSRDGVDIIATDRPIEAQKALEEAGRAAKSGACGVSGPSVD